MANQLDIFQTPKGLTMNLEEVAAEIFRYLEEATDENYSIIIGTDSTNHEGTDFVTAIVVYRQGHGGRFFWRRLKDKNHYTLKHRIYQEANYSLKVAQDLISYFSQSPFNNFNFEIHVDIGPNGPTRDLISEISGLIRGSGFLVKTKPDSYGASSVADRYL